jgi:hypothetical protein
VLPLDKANGIAFFHLPGQYVAERVVAGTEIHDLIVVDTPHRLAYHGGSGIDVQRRIQFFESVC